MTNLFNKIGHDQTLSQQVEEKIESVIRQKKLVPGEKLPTENELCTMFGVSRTAVREALRMLSGRGLITIRKGSGIYVSDYSAKNVTRPMSLFLELNFDKNYVSHLIKVRQMLEPEIARMAAANRTAEDLASLDKNMTRFLRCNTEDHAKEGDLDKEFHLILAKASGNPIIPVMVQPIFELMPKIRTLVYAHIDIARSSAVDYHAKIQDMVRKQDEDGAFQAMTEHLELARKHSEAILAVIN